MVAVSLVSGLVLHLGSSNDERSDRAELVRMVEESSTTRVPSPITGSATTLVIHVAGAVARPGLVRVAAEARVADALEAAGGPAPEADVDRLNLAARVLDGQRIAVVRKGESEEEQELGAEAAAGGVLDLNTATISQLEGLPGIGPATAKAILDYRRRRGGFRSLRQLLDVGGIGERRLADLSERLRV
ncbi:MAG: helix-hairpin-helix domain-containing protein [Acidimicrobiia bacterium]